jgi:hypothetical protein
MFLWNFCWRSTGYTTLCSRRQNSSFHGCVNTKCYIDYTKMWSGSDLKGRRDTKYPCYSGKGAKQTYFCSINRNGTLFLGVRQPLQNAASPYYASWRHIVGNVRWISSFPHRNLASLTTSLGMEIVYFFILTGTHLFLCLRISEYQLIHLLILGSWCIGFLVNDTWYYYCCIS